MKTETARDLHGCVADLEEPIRNLEGFARLLIAAGEALAINPHAVFVAGLLLEAQAVELKTKWREAFDASVSARRDAEAQETAP
jgi:hypothetical protein